MADVVIQVEDLGKRYRSAACRRLPDAARRHRLDLARVSLSGAGHRQQDDLGGAQPFV
jgi:hypothetical protein